MAKTKETYLNEHDEIICSCGNEPILEGFYPCDKTGKKVEPNVGSNWENLYVCDRCGKVINIDELAKTQGAHYAMDKN